MARLLEGKAAAITGGVTGYVHPTTEITRKANIIPQALVVPLFSNMLVKVPASASTTFQTTNQPHNSRVWSLKLATLATESSEYLEISENQKLGRSSSRNLSKRSGASTSS
jgi:hypothetical protein